MTDAYIATSIARRLIVRMHATHERRCIAVFAGPPGIGKTTAIDALNRELPDGIVVVKVARRNAREVLVLQHVLDGHCQPKVEGSVTRRAVVALHGQIDQPVPVL